MSQRSYGASSSPSKMGDRPINPGQGSFQEMLERELAATNGGKARSTSAPTGDRRSSKAPAELRTRDDVGTRESVDTDDFEAVERAVNAEKPRNGESQGRGMSTSGGREPSRDSKEFGANGGERAPLVEVNLFPGARRSQESTPAMASSATPSGIGSSGRTMTDSTGRGSTGRGSSSGGPRGPPRDDAYERGSYDERPMPRTTAQPSGKPPLADRAPPPREDSRRPSNSAEPRAPPVFSDEHEEWGYDVDNGGAPVPGDIKKVRFAESYVQTHIMTPPPGEYEDDFEPEDDEDIAFAPPPRSAPPPAADTRASSRDTDARGQRSSGGRAGGRDDRDREREREREAREWEREQRDLRERERDDRGDRGVRESRDAWEERPRDARDDRRGPRDDPRARDPRDARDEYEPRDPRDGRRGEDVPPTSRLVAKRFPTARPSSAPAPPRREEAQDNGQMEALAAKAEELTNMIAHYDAENEKLRKLKAQREDGLRALEADRAEFEQRRNAELEEFEEYQKREMKKLRAERAAIEKLDKVANLLPDRKERAEIERLKAALEQLQTETADKEKRWKATLERHKKDMAMLKQENQELREEIEFRDKQRLAELERREEEARAVAVAATLAATNHRLFNTPPQPQAPQEPVSTTTTTPPVAAVPSGSPITPSGAERITIRGVVSGQSESRIPTATGAAPSMIPVAPAASRLPIVGVTHTGLPSSAASHAPVSAITTEREPAVSSRIVEYRDNPLAPRGVNLSTSSVEASPPTGRAGSRDIQAAQRPSYPYVPAAPVVSSLPPQPKVGGAGTTTIAQAAVTVAPDWRAQLERLKANDPIMPPAAQPSTTSIARSSPPTAALAPPHAAHARPHLGGNVAGYVVDMGTFSRGVRMPEPAEIVETVEHPDGKLERICTDGRRVVSFGNGTVKETLADGHAAVYFQNGDVKQTFTDKRVVYYYAEAATVHTTTMDGLEVFQFANNQIEKHYPDGTREITFPDQTIKYIFPGGAEESVFPNGTIQRLSPNGERVIEFTNGQKEVHGTDFKRREYPDGTVKVVWSDGKQETHYPSGRVRIKDASGSLLFNGIPNP